MHHHLLLLAANISNWMLLFASKTKQLERFNCGSDEVDEPQPTTGQWAALHYAWRGVTVTEQRRPHRTNQQ
jgi:hypothetical protein